MAGELLKGGLAQQSSGLSYNIPVNYNKNRLSASQTGNTEVSVQID